MDREPLGWTVKRHVVDVAFRELEPPRLIARDRYALAGPTDPEDVWDGRAEVTVSMPAYLDIAWSGPWSGEPSPAL
jgi:hypothetical protein